MNRQIKMGFAKLSLAIVLLTGSALVSYSNPVHDPIEKRAEIKYLGTVDDAVIFDVVFDNPNGGKFSVTVLDETGNQLFQEVYSDKKFDKKFKLPKSDRNKLTFVIRNYKDTDMKQSFEINTHYTEDVVVTKL
jgi:hypothetical protein